MVCINKGGQLQTKKIVVEQSFEQEHKDGETRYFGVIKIGGVSFGYEAFPSPIFNWQDPDEALMVIKFLFSDIEEETRYIRECYLNISVKWQGKEVKLGLEEYILFAVMIILFGCSFFQKKEKAAEKGIPFPVINIMCKVLLTMNTSQVKLLQTKFGCKFD